MAISAPEGKSEMQGQPIRGRLADPAINPVVQAEPPTHLPPLADASGVVDWRTTVSRKNELPSLSVRAKMAKRHLATPSGRRSRRPTPIDMITALEPSRSSAGQFPRLPSHADAIHLCRFVKRVTELSLYAATLGALPSKWFKLLVSKCGSFPVQHCGGLVGPALTWSVVTTGDPNRTDVAVDSALRDLSPEGLSACGNREFRPFEVASILRVQSLYSLGVGLGFRTRAHWTFPECDDRRRW